MIKNAQGTLLRLFIILVTGMILALVAFGVGVTVGASRARASVGAASGAIGNGMVCPTPAPAGEMQPAAPGETLRPTATPARREEQRESTAPGRASGASPLDVELFGEAWGLLEDQFYGDLPVDEEVTYAAIRGLVKELGDPNTTFLDPKQAELSATDMEGHFEGIGARVDEAEGGGVEIKYLFAEQPAQKAGLQVGDVIISVDGKDVTTMELDDAIRLIRGPRDTKVILTVRRGAEEPFDVTIVRARIEIPVVSTKTLADGKVEYISLAEFSSVAPQRLSEALQAAVARQPDGVILDLRGNPGGLLDVAVRIGSYFVPEGNILIERFKDGREQVYARQGRYLLGNLPLAVLVDAGSASASEIVAGAIQDAGVGKLIGETTYGKGSVQLRNSLEGGSQLNVTIARWFTPKDRGIHGVGLEPDIEVTLTDEDVKAERDPQLDRAVELLLTGK